MIGTAPSAGNATAEAAVHNPGRRNMPNLNVLVEAGYASDG
jgi:hypothetical protein